MVEGQETEEWCYREKMKIDHEWQRLNRLSEELQKLFWKQLNKKSWENVFEYCPRTAECEKNDACIDLQR